MHRFPIRVLFLLIVLAVCAAAFTRTPQQQSFNDPNQKENYVLEKIKSCVNNNQIRLCLKKTAYEFLEVFTLKDTLQIIAKHTDDPDVFELCHETLHNLGYKEYENTKNISAVLTECSSFCENGCKNWCINGCYHGAFDAYYIEQGLHAYSQENLVKELKSEITTICSSQSIVDVPFGEGECIHGAGHGVLFLMEGDLSKAFEICQAFETDSEREDCYSGAMMENVISGKELGYPFFREDDPMFTCKSLPPLYQSTCYDYASINFIPFTEKIHVTDETWLRSIELCYQVPKENQRSCFYTMGKLQAVIFGQEKRLANCKRIPDPEYQRACFIGMGITQATPSL